MTTFLLVRHAAHDLLGNILAGRTRDVGINGQGVRDAQRLATRLMPFGVDAIRVSPRVRARETIEPFAVESGLDIVIDHELDEIDFGLWSGRSFADLQGEPGWNIWCNTRSQARPPEGETIADVQRRAVTAMLRLRGEFPGGVLALVSHGDVIKAALAYYLALDLDHFERFDIAPCSISIVIDDGGWSQVRLVNATH